MTGGVILVASTEIIVCGDLLTVNIFQVSSTGDSLMSIQLSILFFLATFVLITVSFFVFF